MNILNAPTTESECKRTGSECDDSLRCLFVPRKYSNSVVNRTGDFFRKGSALDPDSKEWSDEFDKQFDVLSFWRELHAVPLDAVTQILRSRVVEMDAEALVAQRLKRFRSIAGKVRRGSALTRIQDIAGCRAVVSDCATVYRLKKEYEEDIAKSGSQLIPESTKDYIARPKPDGYRGVHLVMRYQTNNPTYEQYNGLLAEIQLRSRLQHSWAMAVETASSLTGQALKSGSGTEDWKEFFRLMASVIAAMEGTPSVPGTINETDHKTHLFNRIEWLDKKLKATVTFQGMSHVVSQLEQTRQDIGGKNLDDLYILHFDAAARETYYHVFERQQFSEAMAKYALMEKETADDPNVQVVLVQVGSVADLREAYPSYFSNAHDFVELIQGCCGIGSELYNLPY